jgi:hypothetical protein
VKTAVVIALTAIALILSCTFDPSAVTPAAYLIPVEMAAAVMMGATVNVPRSRFCTISVACKYSGLSRSSLYEEAGRNPGLLVKWGARSLVNLDRFDAILDALPRAEIKPTKPRTYRKSRQA